MAQDLFPYPKMVETRVARCGARSLGAAAREGLPGDHHFYVTFRTTPPGS